MTTSRRCRRSAAERSPTAPRLFLDLDDGLGLLQAFPEHGRLAPFGRQFGGERVAGFGFGPALGRGQGRQGAGRPLAAPIGQRRRIQPLASQDGADVTAAAGAVGLLQDAELVLGGESPPFRPISTGYTHRKSSSATNALRPSPVPNIR